jgi:putative long chain acyl-CoA synthase
VGPGPPDGFARRCADGETGLLLARAGTSADAPERPLRGIFVKGDAWVSTNDLFRRDADGDHWIVDHVEDLILTASGPLASIPIEDAVGDLDAVSLAVAYGVRLDGGAREIPVVALALRPGRELDFGDLARLLQSLPPAERPVVDDAGLPPAEGPAAPRGHRPAARRRPRAMARSRDRRAPPARHHDLRAAARLGARARSRDGLGG